MPIRFHNTLTRRVEEFVPAVAGEVRMYHCGPTVYSSPHIGNFRSFLLGDLLRRYFEWKGLRVLQVMNLTDVGHLLDDAEEGEDKLEAAAQKAKKSAWEIAEHYAQEFFAALDFLGFKPAHHYPRATTHVPEMIAMIETLEDQGVAYRVPSGNVYFDIAKFPAYGRLSGNTAEELEAGARIEVNPEKRDPRDFALWKIDPRHQMQWDAPWGRGFPGWHIECSAMSKKYLGESFDLHTGGEDNVFPHHECEIAQSEAANRKPFVRCWMHVRHLLVDNTKMSKRLGNVHTIEGLKEKGRSGDAIRIALQKAHYREPLNFTLAGLDEAEKKLARYRDLAERLKTDGAGGDALTAAASAEAETQTATAGLALRFDQALAEDLNVSVAFAVLDEAVTEANRRAPRGADALAWLKLLRELWSIFGLLEKSLESAVLPDGSILKLIEEREAARKARNFARSDEIRVLLKQRGIELLDGKDGVRWRRA
ncbi:MAG: cysteine--tRNA ligase [Planctomycetes bacterium]|nr:cysteine--tRNA ligase [Planctomycetota bacterium]